MLDALAVVLGVSVFVAVIAAVWYFLSPVAALIALAAYAIWRYVVYKRENWKVFFPDRTLHFKTEHEARRFAFYQTLYTGAKHGVYGRGILIDHAGDVTDGAEVIHR